jgi:GNAT superfamily N-acetyltransferase
MQVLRFATRAQIDSIFEENHELWGVPLTPEHYRDYWYSLFLSPWGSSNLRYMALTEEEDGPLHSSLKLYRFTGRFHGEPVIIAGIGAVYTPKSQRTFGGASLLISEVLDYMQKKRATLGLLYSDIGTPFYERLGFVPLPSFVTTGALLPERSASAPGDSEIREAVLSDAKPLVAYHREATASDPFAIDRDSAYWEFILYRRRRYWELAPQAEGRPISLLAVRGGRIIAAGFAVAAPSGLRLEELTCLPGAEGSLRAILDRIWRAGVEAGAPEWSGSLSPEVLALDPRLSGRSETAKLAIPMLAPLGARSTLDGLETDPGLRFLPLDRI